MDGIRRLGLPRQFTLSDLHNAVQRLVDRRIHIIGRCLPANGPSGFWISTTATDYIIYDENAPPTLRSVIIGHELGHELFDDGAVLSATDLADLLAPIASVAGAGSIAWRSQYTDDIERRAEMFASIAVERMILADDSRDLGDTDQELVTRLINALEPAPDQ